MNPEDRLVDGIHSSYDSTTAESTDEKLARMIEDTKVLVESWSHWKDPQGLFEFDRYSKELFLLLLVQTMGKALENLTFTSTKLWDDVKPIKDGPAMRITHPIIEDAISALLARDETIKELK